MAIAGALSPTQALRRSRHLDGRALVGVLLTLAAVGGAMLLFNATNDSRAVLVATRNLPAGATLSAADVTVAHVRVDDSLYQAALSEQSMTQVVGKQLAEPVHPQQMLVRDQISTRPSIGANESAMTIPVSPSSAVAGRIRPGDSVEVLATLNKGKPDSKVSVVLPRVSVYDVSYYQRLAAVNTSNASDANPTSQGQISTVTLILTNEQAQSLALARWNGDLDVILLPPTSAPAQAQTANGQ